MNRKWGIVLLVLLASLLLASPNTKAAEKANNIDPEIQLEIERRINERSLEDYKKIDDRFGDYKWFGMLIVVLLGALGSALIKETVTRRVDSRINEVVEKLKPEEKIQNRIDELYKTIESHKQDIERLKQRAEKELQLKIEEIKNIRPEEMTPEQKGVVEELVEEIEEKPEEEYSADDYFMRGFQARMAGKFEDAIKYYQKAIRLTPTPNAYYNLGISYFDIGEYDQAIEATEKAIQLKPDFSSAYYSLGWAYGKMGKYNQAIEAYQKAIQLKPDFLKAYYNLVCTYSLKKDKNTAIKYLELAIDKGYSKLKHIEEDGDLDFIRKTTEYKRIIKKLKDKLQR